MMKINRKKKTITYYDPRETLFTKKTIPLSIIQNYRRIRIKNWKIRLTQILSLGYVMVIAVDFWLIQKIEMPLSLFLSVYITSVIFVFAKTHLDKKLLHTHDPDGDEYIVIETYLDERLAECGEYCDKIEKILKKIIEHNQSDDGINKPIEPLQIDKRTITSDSKGADNTTKVPTKVYDYI